jgi:hypothetical protein
MKFRKKINFSKNLSDKLNIETFKSAKEVEKFQISVIFIPKPN